MSAATTIRLRLEQWTPRARLYAAAVLLTLCYLMLGLAGHDNPRWVLVHLPLSAASFLLLGLSAAEAYLYVQRMRRRQAEWEAARVREQESVQRLAAQREHILQEIARTLIDKLDIHQLPSDVLEKIQEMFTADLVAIWVAGKGCDHVFELRGLIGSKAHAPEQLRRVAWTFPCYEGDADPPRQFIAGEGTAQLSPLLAPFNQREQVRTTVLSPIVRRGETVGVIAVFYRDEFPVSPGLAAEMQTLAHLLASAIQAEELYRDLVQVQKVQSIGT